LHKLRSLSIQKNSLFHSPFVFILFLYTCLFSMYSTPLAPESNGKRIKLDFNNPETPPRTPGTLDSQNILSYPYNYPSSSNPWYRREPVDDIFKSPMPTADSHFSKPASLFVSYWDEQKTNVLQLEHCGQLITKRLDNQMINGTKLLNMTVDFQLIYILGSHTRQKR
jgi:hypothetical protein